MKTQNSASANVVSKSENTNAAKQQVNTKNNSPKRVVETREMYEVIFNHSVSLVAQAMRSFAYGEAGSLATEKSREGFAFGPTTEQPHTRGYAKSLIWGFTSSKAGKTLKGLEGEQAKQVERYMDAFGKPEREEIAIAILTGCKLVKGDSKAIKASLNKVEPKREKAFTLAVLVELQKMAAIEDAAAHKSSKTKGESKPKTKPAARKSSKPKTETKPAPKRGKANGKPNAAK